MSNRTKSEESRLPKVVLKQMELTDKVTLKRRLASGIQAHLLDPKTSERLGYEIELINTGKTYAYLIQVNEQYFTVKVQEHRIY